LKVAILIARVDSSTSRASRFTRRIAADEQAAAQSPQRSMSGERSAERRFLTTASRGSGIAEDAR
jgi:hypothetical protein